MKNSDSHSQTIRLYALLSNKFNSFYRKTVAVEDFLTGQKKELMVINQFVSADKRFTGDKIRVGYWRLPADQLKNRIQDLQSFEPSGEPPDNNLVDFYLPFDLADEYPGLLESLGQPDRVSEAVMSPSGRSLWLLESENRSVCIKIDTMQLNQRKYFSERVLDAVAIRHSTKMNKFLENEKNIFFETHGYIFTFSYLYEEKEPKKYQYLIREVNSEKSEIAPDDILIPMTAICSVSEFWQNKNLVQSLHLPPTPSDFLLTQIAPAFAQLIRNSFDHTFVHFELHAQNVTLHCREGRVLKIMNQDLQDVLFDPISFILNELQKQPPQSTSQALELIAKLHAQTLYLLGTTSVNPQGQLIVHRPGWRECFNAVSFYRRYIRNLADYSKIYSYFEPVDFFENREFEAAILKSLSFSDDNLGISALEYSDGRSDLYWCLYQYHVTKQCRLLKNAVEKFLTPAKTRAESHTITALDFLGWASHYKMIASSELPTHTDLIQPDLLTDIYELIDKKLLVMKYGGKDVMVLMFDPSQLRPI